MTLDSISSSIAILVGFIGVIIMTWGALQAAVHCIIYSWQHRRDGLSRIRIELGQHLALGLEFMVGKDIIESIIRPSWDELGKLAAIIALRTAVTFMLTWELREIKNELRTKN